MLPKLPTEIIQHIVFYAVPDKTTYATYKARYRWILAYSLVNSMWHTVAQKELHSDLWVRSTQDLRSWKLLDKARAVGRGQQLDLGEPSAQWEYRDAELPELEGVNEVTLRHMRLSGEDLMKLRDVETLHLHHCKLYDTPLRDQEFTPHFLRLHTLSLTEVLLPVDSFPSWATWLTPTAFPFLQQISLNLEQAYVPADNDPIGLTTSLERLGPQIQSFSLKSEEEGGDIVPWHAFTSLQRLSLYPSFLTPLEDLQHPFDSLPAGIAYLRIGHVEAANLRGLAERKEAFEKKEVDPDTHLVEEREARAWDGEVWRGLAEAFEQDMPIVRDLKVLKVEGCGMGMWTELEEDIEKVKDAMRARGGEVVRQIGWEGGWSHCSWERYLYFE